MNTSDNNRASFSSRLGVILATAGSAVGLGNIWRFPVEAGNNGGGAFLLLYILCVALLGLPLMSAEFIVGRAARTNTAQAYQQLARGRLLRQIGKLGVFTGWFIMCYYVVVSGWTLYYLFDALTGRFGELAEAGGATGYAENFTQFVENPWKPVACMAVFVLLSHYVIVRGVEKGIERFSKVLMPLLFIIMVVLAGCAFFTEGTAEACDFLFRPDFSKITYRTVLAAMGQAFYSLSLAMGCLCTFASYFSKDTNLMGTAVRVAGIDSLVAVMSGFIIFPAVFSIGMQPDAGPSLVFIALPQVFHQAFGFFPPLSYAVSVLFYFLLVLATLTSVISLHEVPTAYLSERFRLPRGVAATVVTGVCMVVGGLCSLSMGPLKGMTVAGRGLFDFFDYFSSSYLLPVGGLLIAVFVGWFLRRGIIREQLTNGGLLSSRPSAVVVCLLRYLAPLAILLIFLNGIFGF